MTASGETVQVLADVIARQLDAAHSLLATLERERTALTALDAEAIDAAGTAKLAQLREIEALESDRTTLLEMYDVEPESFTGLDGSGDLATAWQRLLQLLKRCRLLNESNGALVALQRRQVQQALTLLSGAAPEAEIYGPDGMTLDPGRTTTIATA